MIVENGELIAEIKLVAGKRATLRPYALCVGKFRVPDGFDAPLPDEIIKLFEG